MKYLGKRVAVAVAGMAMAGATMLGGAATAGAEQSQASTSPEPASTAPSPMANGCTGVPDSYGEADFKPACDAHDACYSAGSTASRLECDDRLRKDLVKACDLAYLGGPDHPGCVDRTDLYYNGVRELGRSHYEGSGDPT